MKAKWFEHFHRLHHAKFGMSMCVLGLSAELKAAGVAVNALWPRTTIATSRGRQSPGRRRHDARQPQTRDHGRRRLCHFHEAVAGIYRTVLHRRQVLYASGVRAFEHYRVDRSVPLMADFFVPTTTCRRRASP